MPVAAWQAVRLFVRFLKEELTFCNTNMDEVGTAAPREQQHDGKSTSTTAVDSPSSAKRNRSSPSSSNPQLKKAPLARMESAASMEIESEDEHHRWDT